MNNIEEQLDIDCVMSQKDSGTYLVAWAYIFGRLPAEYEEMLLKIGSAWNLYQYALNVLKQRWYEAEKIIQKSIYVMFFYIKDIIKERVLEIEPLLKTNKALWHQYKLHFSMYENLPKG